MNPRDMLQEFHWKFGLIRNDRPTIIDPDEAELRQQLLEEEVQEVRDAIAAGDLVEIADGLADCAYVLFGTALAYGIDLQVMMEEVHRSNMTKLGEDGQPIYREDGKVLKGPNFQEPRISLMLDSLTKLAELRDRDWGGG